MLWSLWGVGTESIPAFGAFSDGLPGFTGLGFTDEDDTSEPENEIYDISTYDETIEGFMSKNEVSDEPYIFHFPDGNATIARLLVRKMIPNAISGSTMVLPDIAFGIIFLTSNLAMVAFPSGK